MFRNLCLFDCRVFVVSVSIVLFALLPAVAFARDWTEMGITAPQMAQYFQQHAGSQDIARVDHPSDIGLISGITVGRKMVIFKSVSEIETFMRSNANSLDIIGYNLEPGQTHNASELANPVAAAKAAKAVAAQYGKLLAIGLTKSLTSQYGPAMAPYADIWILQVQKAQDDPRQVVAWVQPMSKALKQANPNVQIAVQIRTDSQPAALSGLINSMTWLDGVSILTQRSDVQDAVNVASAFFGGQQSTAGNQQPRLYGDRLPSKDGRWLLPVATLHLGSNERDHINRGSVQAWDLIAPSGSPVFPIADGVVKYAGCDNKGGYGCWLYIEHAGGIKTIMGHCTHGSITVKTGQSVKQWDVVCTVGMTGMTSFGPHTHLEIHKSGGGRYNVGDFWDASRMKYQRLGNAVSNEVPSQIGVVGGDMVTGQPQPQPQATVMATRYDQLLTILRQYPPQLVSLAVMVLLGVLVLVYWLGGKVERIAIIAGVSGMAGAAVIVWLFMPIGVVAQPSNAGQRTEISGGDSWKAAYAFMRKWEGGSNPPCVHDPVRTLKGVTQATYTAWLRSQGQPNADVCAALTEQQAEAIYYQRYWLASGADKLEPAAALVVFDHAVNAGVGEGKALIAQCGSDVRCLINARYADYKTKGNCAQFCKAWFSRVDDLVKYLQKGS